MTHPGWQPTSVRASSNDREFSALDRAIRTSGVRSRVSRVLADGHTFGAYAVGRLLGKTGLSETYEVTREGRTFALDVMDPDLAEDSRARASFLEQAERAARLRHGHVLRVLETGCQDELPYFVTHPLLGETLAELLERRAPLAPAPLLELLLPVVAAVAYAHEQGVLHRALKPQMVWLERENERLWPQVRGFGVAQALHGARTSLTVGAAGCSEYLAPEQAALDGPVDERSDQYALGVLLYQAATGRLPHDEAEPGALLHTIAFDTPLAPSRHIALPAALDALILRALQRVPSERFPSVHALGRALLTLADAESQAAWEDAFRADPPSRQPGDENPTPEQAAVRDQVSEDQWPTLICEPPPFVAEKRDVEISAPDPRTPRAPARSRRVLRNTVWGAGLLSLGFLLTLGVERLRELVPTASAPSTQATEARRMDVIDVQVSTSPSHARLELDGRAAAVGKLQASVPSDGQLHALRVSAEGYTPHVVHFRNRPPPREIRLIATASLAPDQLKISTSDPSRNPKPATPKRPAPLAPRVALAVPAVPEAAPAQAFAAPSEPSPPPEGAAALALETPPSEERARAASPPRPAVRIISDLTPRVRAID